MRVLYLEPWEGGSHARFGETLRAHGEGIEWTWLTLPGRHWKWRMRGAALAFAPQIRERWAEGERWDVVLASSYLHLAELRGLAPCVARLPAGMYFHENQFAFPSRSLAETPGRAAAAANDQDYGFTQLVAALAAQGVAFNSEWNRTSFFAGARALWRRLPDAKPGGLIDEVEARSCVVHYPVDVSWAAGVAPDPARWGGDAPDAGPLLVWNHRWEHDKAPERFFAALRVLARRDVPFRVAVCGRSYRAIPPVFTHAREWLGERVVQWGRVESRQEYASLLRSADVVVSTARHEFFGVAVLEAALLGAYPLVPDALAYRELYAPGHRYAVDAAGEASVAALVEALESLVGRWQGRSGPGGSWDGGPAAARSRLSWDHGALARAHSLDARMGDLRRWLRGLVDVGPG